MKLYLDSIPVTWNEEKMTKPTFTLRRKDEEGLKAVSFTGDLVFYGDDYLYLYQKLVTDPNALNNSVELKFVYDCCNPELTWTFQIVAESLKWCANECSLTAAAIEKSTEADQLVCLKNKLITDNTPTASFPSGFKAKQHPRFTYCNELRPDWMHHAIILLTLILNLVLLIISPIILILVIIGTIINAIGSAIDGLCGNCVCGGNNCIDFDGNNETNLFQEAWNAFNNLTARCLGCGRKHIGPLVRDYATNVCEQCGLSFSSSILNNPASDYFNLCWVNAPVHKGVPVSGTSAGVSASDHWIERNTPIENGTRFFDKLKPVFNAEWRIENNTLKFERRDFFQSTTPWIDLTALQTYEYDVCYAWAKKSRYSYAEFEYMTDAFNWVGAEAKSRWSAYAIDWNQPYNPQQKGVLHPVIEFSPARFRNDGIDEDVLSKYTGVSWLSPAFGAYENVMIIGGHTCFIPMLLIWDGVDAANAKVVIGSNLNNYPDGQIGQVVGPNQFYNYPMWFGEGFPGNLYTNFWHIDDPRSQNYTGIEYTATVEMTCARLQTMSLDGQVMTTEGKGNIDEITLNFADNKITVRGLI